MADQPMNACKGLRKSKEIDRPIDRMVNQLIVLYYV